MTNQLLSAVGINAKPMVEFSELKKSASSMFVAIFEAMFQIRLRDVKRSPNHHIDYVHNAQTVIEVSPNAYIISN